MCPLCAALCPCRPLLSDLGRDVEPVLEQQLAAREVGRRFDAAVGLVRLHDRRIPIYSHKGASSQKGMLAINMRKYATVHHLLL
jgi:hypothetical protein